MNNWSENTISKLDQAAFSQTISNLFWEMDLRYGLGKSQTHAYILYQINLEPHNYIILLHRNCTQIYSVVSFNLR